MPGGHGDLAAANSIDDEFSPIITPRQVTLRDRVTIASVVPFTSAVEVPRSLLAYLSDQLNKEIEKGDTYAMIDPVPVTHFGPYWFSHFGAIMLLGDIKSLHEAQRLEGTVNWSKVCLGSFNIRPNYPGRSSHVCNGMFLVTNAARNKGVGRLMGETYLDWAARLGYTYAVFNLVYESNVVSCRLWEGLGFKRIGRVPGAGRVMNSPGDYVDAIIYGRDLGADGEDSVAQDRFDKIRYYLKHSKYPRGADRAEKSRLRSAATHYKLVSGENGDGDKLMLKDKEVVSDPQQQYEIANQMHMEQHAGINKTTAAIAVKYHWVRIKETVNRVIRDCPHCKDTLKTPATNHSPISNDDESDKGKQAIYDQQEHQLPRAGPMTAQPLMQHPTMQTHQPQNPFAAPPAPHASILQGHVGSLSDYTTVPLDPQVMNLHQQMPRFQTHDAMNDPYGHATHGLHDSKLEGGVRHHIAPNEYHMMVDDPSETDANAAMQQEALGLVHPQGNDVHHEPILKYQYVGHPDDELDFT